MAGKCCIFQSSFSIKRKTSSFFGNMSSWWIETESLLNGKSVKTSYVWNRLFSGMEFGQLCWSRISFLKSMFLLSSQRRAVEKWKKNWKKTCPLKRTKWGIFLTKRLRTQHLRTRIWMGEGGVPYLIDLKGRTKTEGDDLVVTKWETGFLPQI